MVANAGIQAYGSFASTSEEDWNNVIDINVKGTANTVRAALPHMLSRKYGRIVIISSGQGRHGFKNGSAYSASKWGLIGLMKSVAWEVGKDGITVNCVEPGLVDTPLTRNPGRWRELIRTAGKRKRRRFKPSKRPSQRAGPARSWAYHGCSRTKSRQPWSFSAPTQPIA